MSHPTDERIGHRMVFALAQVPYSHPNGQLIASLAPLMDVETGATLGSEQHAFPTNGYVFWGSAQGDLEPGDLVVGTLSKASGNFYGSEDQSWYQVSPEAGTPHGEVFEYVKTTLPDDVGLRRLVDGRKMIDTSHEPPKLFFVWVNEQLVGPFHPHRPEHFQSKMGYCCKPTDGVRNLVRVAKGTELSEYVRNERGYCEVQISSTTHHPAKISSGKFTCCYRLIRNCDLASYSESTDELMLPTDEFAITKACNWIIVNRKKNSEAKAVLNSLVEELHANERQIESGIAETIAEITQRVKLSDETAERIATALAKTEAVGHRIEAAIAQRVKEAILERTATIEAEVNKQSEKALAELTELEAEVAKLEKVREEKWTELEEYSGQMEVESNRITKVVEAASQRLTDGRDQLLGDISLLAPLFGSSTTPSINGHVPPPSRFSSNGSVHRRAESEKETPATLGEPMTEAQFLAERLLPSLGLHGITIAENKAMDLHALFVASRLIFVPDVSWAVAYCEAMGGTAVAACVTPEPDWMSFRKCYEGELGAAIERAMVEPSRLHVVILDGVDRCPSHAWLQPMFQVVSNWKTTLPEPSGHAWPDNLRLVFTAEESVSCFQLPTTFARWIVPFESEEANLSSELVIMRDGHLPLDSWLLKSDTLEGDFAFEALVKEVESEPSPLLKPLRRILIRRLREVFLRLGREEDRIAGPLRWLLRPIELMESPEE